MLRVTLKGLLARKLRFAMAGAAVVIGVSFMAGTFMLTDSIRAKFQSAVIRPAAGRDTTVRARSVFQSTDVVAVNVQRGPVPESLVDTIRNIPGVKSAAGTVQGYAQIVAKDGKAIRAENAAMIGTNWIPMPELSLSRLVIGHPPVGGDQVALDARTFKHYRFRLGDRVTVLSAHAPRDFTIVGSLDFDGSDSPGGATVVTFDGPTAQAMVGKPGAWDEVEAAGVRPGVTAGVLTQRISDALPPQYDAAISASVATALAKSVRNTLGPLPVVLLIFTGIAIFAGVFIVYNTFSILVTQRSREMALLLAIGATRGQVSASVVGEAAVVGVLASGVGLGLGALVALGMQRLFIATGWPLATPNVHVAARTVALSVVVGTAVTVASSIVPARRASRMPPIVAMTDAERREPKRYRNPSLIGTVLCAGALALLFSGLLAHPPRVGLVAAAGALVFVGLAALSPRLIVPLARIVGAPARAWGGVAGRLSQDNATRNPPRTVAAAAALMVGVAQVAIMGIVGASMKATSAKTVRDAVRADSVVSPTGGGFVGGATLDGFSSDLAAQLRNRPELAAVAEIRSGFWHRGPRLQYLSAIDPMIAPRVLNFTLSSGSVSNLVNGQVLIDATVARSNHLKVGDRLAMGFDATGNQDLIVGGTFKPNEFVESYVVSIQTYEANYPKGSLDQQLFILDRADPTTATRVIRQLTTPYPSLQVQSPAALRAAEQRQLDTVINLGYVLMAFSIMIALIGIINTLALSVAERTRELGLLRAVGMHQLQVRRMVRWESVQVCLLGAIIGLVTGTGLGVALVSALSFGAKKVIIVPSATLVVVVALAAAAGVVAAIIPARRAARLDVLNAIAVP